LVCEYLFDIGLVGKDCAIGLCEHFKSQRPEVVAKQQSRHCYGYGKAGIGQAN
jgi:hypothetical protein